MGTLLVSLHSSRLCIAVPSLVQAAAINTLSGGGRRWWLVAAALEPGIYRVQGEGGMSGARVQQGGAARPGMDHLYRS